MQTDKLKSNPEGWFEIGSYVRKYNFFVKCYRVTFYTLAPDTIVEMYLKQSEGPDKNETIIDSLTDFLLNPKNHIPLKLTIESLRDYGNYNLFKKAVRDKLEQAKFPVDENWNLFEKMENQKDVNLYVNTIMGCTKDQNEAPCEKKGKGDLYDLTINANEETRVNYIPCQKDTAALCQKVCFSSSELLRGIFATYLSRKACSGDLKDKLPQALMKKILLTYAETTGRGNPNLQNH